MKNIFYLIILVIVFTKISKSQTTIDTLEVSTGWNIIGALFSGAILDIINTEPPGIISSTFFGYNPGGGYYSADTLMRGNGYWVKINQNGIIIIGIINNCGIINYSGKLYNTVIIGDQCWLKENLDVGIAIFGNQNQSNNGVIEKYCYNNDPSNCNLYGGLYQWDETMQYITTEATQGICPTGWHIPTLSEFQLLAVVVANDGNALLAVGQGGGTNSSGFSALLGGIRSFDYGEFYYLGFDGHFWSSTEQAVSHAYKLTLNNFNNSINLSSAIDTHGFSVRCLKD